MSVMLHPNRPVMMVPDVPDIEHFLNVVHPSKVVEDGNGKMWLAAPHNSDTVRVVRNMGLKVPSSLATRYNWTGRFEPYDYQRTAAEFLTMHNRCLNLSDMGTGKTPTALWAADHLMNEGLVKRVLVLTTMSCIHAVWEREIMHVTPHRRATVLHAARAKRRKLAEESTAEYLILNHDGLSVVLDILLRKKDIDLIIFDEASALKNGQTARYKQMTKLLKAWGPRLWLLTGTPTPNAPTDAWALGRLVNPYNAETNPQGTQRSFVRFRDSCMRQAGPYKWVARPNAQVVVRTILQPAVRFKKEDCIDLPPVMYMERETPLSAEQTKAFKEIKKAMVTTAKTEKQEGVVVTAINAAAKLTKLLQICSGAVYSDTGRVGTLKMPDRLGAMDELIEGATKKVIVFVPYRHAIDRVRDHLIDKGITCDVMHGGVTGNARSMLIKNFMDEENPKVLIAHPRTASHGLNLTCADTIIWFGPTFSAEQYQQANERMARPGQDAHMSIYHLFSSPVEEKAFQLLKDRQLSQQGLLRLYEDVIK